jgi:type IV secretory pathway TraG/TraD family ATPase VirD4
MTLREAFDWLFARPPPHAASSLDYELFAWNDRDRFRIRDLLRSVAILGATGSGKTSGSGKFLAQVIVNYRRTCGLVLCAKPEDKPMWQEIFAKAARTDDLLIFEPGGPLRLNFLDYVLKTGGDTREITKCITSINETLRSRGGNRGEGGEFWEAEQERMIYNAVEIVKLATGHVSAPDLQRFISTAAKSVAEILTESWQAKFCNQCIHQANARPKSLVEQHDFQLAVEYWLGEVPSMADRTRSSIEVGVFGVLHVFNTGIVRELVSGETNVSPDDLLRDGRWLLVNMAPAQYGDAGTFINAGIKFLTEWRILRRQADPSDFVNVIWCDEAQQFVNKFDSHYLAQCRSHLGCLCLLTQSLHSYYTAMSGETGRHQADSLLSNMNLRIVHALGDAESATWASRLIGRELRTFIGGSSAPQGSMFDSLMGQSQFTGNFSQQYTDVLEPAVFMNGLRTGGLANRYMVDAIVIKSGEPFANGKNYLWTSFSQR